MDRTAGVTAPGEAPTGFHPAFRILLLLTLAAMLFGYSLAGIGASLLIIAIAAVVAGDGVLRSMLRAVRRIRWLLLSIIIIYLWFAPEPGPVGRPWYLPDWGELQIALQRSGVLVVLVCAVELLRRRTPTPLLAAGLVFLLQPLRLLGIETQTFARRLALVLEAVPATAERVAKAAGSAGGRGGPARWAEIAAGLLREIERDADAGPAVAQLPPLPRPLVGDWGLLAVGVAACLLVRAL